MLFAAHPDDESLACGVVLQRAVRAGAKIRVIYVTDGENNPWPQRVLERRWRLTDGDRKRWGILRRTEAIAALDVLGVDARAALFLGLPDQRLTELLKFNPGPVVEEISKVVNEWRPTDIFLPSILDIHPDHSALGILLQFRSNNRTVSEPTRWSYLIHGHSAAFHRDASSIGQTESERVTKLRAIGCHQTQVRLFGSRFWKHAVEAERFVKLDQQNAFQRGRSIVYASRNPELLSLKLERPLKLLPRSGTTALVVGYDQHSNLRCIKTDLPLSTSVLEITDLTRGEKVDPGKYRGSSFSGDLEIPAGLFAPEQPLFIKIERRGWFFDEAGWLELAPCAIAGAGVLSEDLSTPARRVAA